MSFHKIFVSIFYGPPVPYAVAAAWGARGPPQKPELTDQTIVVYNRGRKQHNLRQGMLYDRPTKT
jgi:hypothetical protein